MKQTSSLNKMSTYMTYTYFRTSFYFPPPTPINTLKTISCLSLNALSLVIPNANALIRFANATALFSKDVVLLLGSVVLVSKGSYSADRRASLSPR